MAEMLLLYAITEGRARDIPLPEQVEAALRGGVTLVQLRSKGLGSEALLALAKQTKAVTDRFGVPLIINDNVEIALACGAGVHLGPEDMGVAQARALMGSGAIIGASARSVEQAVAAQQGGASYLGSGAMFETITKPDAKPMTLETLGAICAAVSIPVVAIGGIGQGNLLRLAGSGAKGAAVSSGLFGQSDITAAAKALRALAEETFVR